MLVGNYHKSLAKVDKVGAVGIEKKNLDLPGLFDQAAHRVAKFIHAQNLDAGTPNEHEMIAESLVTRLLRYSTAREPLTRDTFIKLLTGWVKESPRQKRIVDIARIDKYAPEKLIGREAETQVLNDAWKQAVSGEAHRQLYKHLCATANEGKQPTLEELQPLYQAVTHGCLAGLQLDVFENVFYKRLDRQEAYCWKKLGAFGTTLGGVACFFEQQWDRVTRGTTPTAPRVTQNTTSPMRGG
jgi:hypothetical protein